MAPSPSATQPPSAAAARHQRSPGLTMCLTTQPQKTIDDLNGRRYRCVVEMRRVSFYSHCRVTTARDSDLETLKTNARRVREHPAG